MSAERSHEPRIIIPAFIAITITIVMAYPINVYPTRYAIESMCFGGGGGVAGAAHASTGLAVEEGSQAQAADVMVNGQRARPTRCWLRARHAGLTIAIAGVTLVSGLLLKDISTVFSLMGGTASPFVCFIIPSAAAYRLGPLVPQNRTALGRAAVLGLGAFGLLIGVLSTATTIADMFDMLDHEASHFDPCNASTY